ncbi:MAG: hypothetical protein AAF399_04495 [Bacteroidota bacterium]
MKILPICMIICLPMTFPLAQNMTISEAVAYAKKLHEVQILSEKGSQLMIEHITGKIDSSTALLYFSPPVELSASYLLRLLEKFFWEDHYYRLGFTYTKGIYFNWVEQHGRWPETKEEMEEIRSLTAASYSSFDGQQIENAIPDEDGFSSIPRKYLNTPIPLSHHLIHTYRSTLGKTCTRTLRDLLQIGIIDSVVFHEVLPEIGTEFIFLEAQTVERAAIRTEFYEEYESNKAREHDWIKELQQAGVISAESSAHLLAYEPTKQLRKGFDILPYCNQSLLLPSEQLPKEPTERVERILASFSELIPDFSYQNLQILRLQESTEWKRGGVKRQIQVNFDCENQTYGTRVLWGYATSTTSNWNAKESTPSLWASDFTSCINRFLLDQQVPYRLFPLVKRGGDHSKIEAEGFVLLTEFQWEIWNKMPGEYLPKEESFDRTLSSSAISQTLAEYKRIGLFSHLTKEEIEEGDSEIRYQQIHSPLDLLRCYPKTIVSINPDSEDFTTPYKQITLAFSNASKGYFQPYNIVDEFEKSWEAGMDSSKFEFSHHGNTFSTQFPISGDRWHWDLCDLIEEAIEDNGVDIRLVQCLFNGYEVEYMFLTKQQHESLLAFKANLFESEREIGKKDK